MKISTYVVFNIDTWEKLAESSYEYDGPVFLLKKGRSEAKRVAQRAEAREKEQDRIRAEAEGIQRTNRAAAEGLISPYEQIGEGELSQFASGQLGADTENISRVYRGMREAAERAIAGRGFGRAPSGIGASERNTLNRQQAEAETDAFRRAQGLTEEGRRVALGYRSGAEQFYDPTGRNLAAGTLGTQTGEAAERINRLGSTFGDIMSGIGTVGSLVAAPFTGGASLAGLAATQMGKSAMAGAKGAASAPFGSVLNKVPAATKFGGLSSIGKY